MVLLGIDTESGGISQEFDLLTLSLSVIIDFEIVESLNLKVKPDPVNGRTQFFVQAEALRVNGIDLAQHDLEAITYSESKKIIYEWLKEMKGKYGKLLPFGNGISRDIQLITRYTISSKSWDQFVKRNPIELTSIGNCLKLMGLIPEDQSLALSNIAEHFGATIDPDVVHTAEYDVWLGIQALKGYSSLMGGLNC
jgi:hypothetical protein